MTFETLVNFSIDGNLCLISRFPIFFPEPISRDKNPVVINFQTFLLKVETKVWD